MDENEQVIGSDELIVTVEMGDEFEPGGRTAAALHELVEALHEEHSDDDVAAYSQEGPEVLRSFSFGFSPQEPLRNFYEGWPAKWKDSVPNGKTNS